VLRKLRLDQTKTYEQAIAVNRIVKMLIAFIQGREHDLKIGSEQGGIPKWDDLVIEESDGAYEHVQIKQQITDFSDHPCIRDNVKHRDGSSELRPLSALDEAIHSLGIWVSENDPSTCVPRRHFVIEVPNLVTQIKNGLELRVLYNLCNNYINPSATVTGLDTLAAHDNSIRDLFNWLRTWCDFNDTDHILKAMRLLQIKESGNETDLDADTMNDLKTCFADYAEALIKIKDFIYANSSFTSAISPRPLLGELRQYLLPDILTWTQYHKTEMDWEISGTHDSGQSSVESPRPVVNSLWNSSRKSVLKVGIPNHGAEVLLKAITRLALHLEHLSTAHIQDVDRWQEAAKNSVGKTLGLGEYDIELSTLQVLEGSSHSSSSDYRKLRLLNDHDSEGTALSVEMHRITWLKVLKYVDDKITGMNATPIRTEIEIRWRNWKDQLESDVPEQMLLCKSMLHPAAEGEDILAILRVGPKTAPLIANGLYHLLIASIALSNTDKGWKLIDGELSIEVRGLHFWSGPSGKTRQPRKLTAVGIFELLGKESSKILILSKLESSSTAILETSMAYESSQQSSMASSHKPILIITDTPKLGKLVSDGDISVLRAYIRGELDKGMKAKEVN